MKYKLVIFDMDGTILDTLEDLKGSINYALKKSGLPERNLNEVRYFVGNGLMKLVERAVPDGTSQEVIETVYKDLTIHYKANCAVHTKPYDGIVEVLKTLKEKGYLTACVSNKADFGVQELVKEYFNGLFDVALGENPDRRKKPAPDMVNEVLKQLNIGKKDAVYVGDSNVDIETARNSGLHCISVSWGFRTTEELVTAGAEKIVTTPEELLGEV